MKEKIKATLIDISKKSTLFRTLLRKSLFIKNRLKYLLYMSKRVDEKLIVFESFMGRKYADSPKAIYEYMLGNKEYSEYKFVWAFRETSKYEFMERNERSRIVKYGSSKYYKIYAGSKYWVTNSRIPEAILKKKEQVYVQCWHGTPLKRLGYDIKVKGGNAMNSVKDIRHKYKSDAKRYSYMVSPSKFCTEKFISAFNLKELDKENIVIEEGYPRNDFLINYTKDDVKSIKHKLKIPENKKIILYAPTWRDDQHQSGLGYTYKNQLDFAKLKENLSDEYIVLYRAHYFVANQFEFDKYNGFIKDVADVDDINELYVISDILITDYSSVFFDYAILQRPIIFYMYDLENYRDEIRGFYVDLNELPGEIIAKEDELTAKIQTLKTCKYNDFNKKYNCLDDGEASARVCRKVFI